MNDMIRQLMERKSVRVYEDAPIPEEDVRTILEAAVQAPTAGNMTLWSCIRVTDTALKEELAEQCDHQPFIAKAPLVLVFYADYHRWMNAFHSVEIGEPVRKPGMGDRLHAAVDTIIAAQSAVIAAEALDYGACYIGDVVEHWEWHKARFNLPDHVQPVCLVVIGVPTQQQKERSKPQRFAIDDIVFENSYRDEGAEKMREMIKVRQQMNADEDLDRWLIAFAKRKWNSDFSRERGRSTEAMMRDWIQE